MADILELIKTRRSCRKYQSAQIQDEELVKVLEAGTYAASGHGLQDPWIVAVQNSEVIQELTQMNTAVMEYLHTNGLSKNPVHKEPYYKAPTILLVFASKDNTNAIKDASLVLGNMMLEAHAIGLASCWINRADRMFETERGKQLLKEWNLPDNLIGVGSLSLGYRDGASRPAKERKKDYFRIIK